jgi:acyl-CoA synthetase (AMP-forming)/AMP-acid ligase II
MARRTNRVVYSLDIVNALLYTSGTTGMPKGCAFTMSRLYTTLFVRRAMMGDSPESTDAELGRNGDAYTHYQTRDYGDSRRSVI